MRRPTRRRVIARIGRTEVEDKNCGKVIHTANRTASEINPRIKLPAPVADIYRAVAELEKLYHGHKFTPDGHGWIDWRGDRGGAFRPEAPLTGRE